MAKKADEVARENTTNLEAFLARAGAKERAKIEKHLSLRDAETGPAFGKLWRKSSHRLWAVSPQCRLRPWEIWPSSFSYRMANTACRSSRWKTPVMG